MMKICTTRHPFVRLAALMMLCGAAQALVCRPAVAGSPGDVGSDFDFGGIRGHVDIPEIAGVPGGGGSWLPPILDPLNPDDPIGDVRPLWPLEPLPVPGELPKIEDPSTGWDGPGLVTPTYLPLGTGGSPGVDLEAVPSGSVPGPGGVFLLGLGLVTASGRRRR